MASETTKETLVKAAENFLAAAKNFSEGDFLGRMALMKQADNLRIYCENPVGTIFRQWQSVHLIAALDILTSMGILHKIPAEGTIGSKELADAVDLHVSVVERAMRVICAQGIGEEPSPDVYRHNAKSLAYVQGTSQYVFKALMDQNSAFRQVSRYFRTHKKDDIMDLRKSPFAFAHGLEGSTYFEVISADADRLETFNQTLVQMNESMPVLGMFPFSSLKAEVEAEPWRPFIVDVGGGTGRVIMSIQQEAPKGFGAEIVLQDRPEVLASVPEDSIPNVTKMVHDFFTPQPVKNAHVYLLRRILHDFYEPVCIDIVKNIASAMGPTSRLLIGDFVVPEKTHVGDDFMIYWMDLSMMMISGKEKTAKQFEMILNAAGLELVKIWPFPFGAQAIVEARLKHQ